MRMFLVCQALLHWTSKCSWGVTGQNLNQLLLTAQAFCSTSRLPRKKEKKNETGMQQANSLNATPWPATFYPWPRRPIISK